MKKVWLVIRSQSFMAVVALLSVIFAIYQTFIYERKGEIGVTIAPPAKVLDIHKAVGGLEVSYEGENLRDSKKTLWVISATIRNEGNAEIRKTDFDKNDPVGFFVEKGKIVDTPSLRTSIPYLQRNFKLSQVDNKITVSPSILEPGDTVFVSFLVLGDEVSPPSISALGKIAGSGDIQFKSSEDSHSNVTSDNLIFTDALWLQPLRMVIYTLFFIVTIAVIASLFAAVNAPVNAFKNLKNERRRRAAVDKFKRGEGVSREVRAAGLIYIEQGEVSLFRTAKILRKFRKRAELRRKLQGVCGGEELDKIVLSCYGIPFYGSKLISSLGEFGFAISDSATIEQIDDWLAELRELSAHLEIDLERDFTAEGWDQHPDNPVTREEISRMEAEDIKAMLEEKL
ncbi:hypothetical protein BK674_08145 [Pseudomonas moraviensis]|uniref:Uncharacterized protein n=1 Tax=Pseudomonas moraviensis TaxID=321662 RepID=A0A423NQK1_9PSED|nr:hypothetical protein [Pseudomonas moraviensis]ROO00540.1 hypothetical protein BK674_08145 [Pseudomonas moraviensis]